MELMTSLLLCALVAFLPQAPGQSRRKFSFFGNEFNNSLSIRRKTGSMGKNIILNKNVPLHNKITDLQSTFMDPSCRGCYICMERAIKAHKPHIHKVIEPRISSENFQDINNRNVKDITRRDKRKVEWGTSNLKKSKKSKPKKNKGISLMKYNDNDGIYALKINETISVLDVNNKSETVMTCQVYSIKKSVSCDLPEANLILTGSRKKNKKGKKGHGKREAKIEPIKTVIAPVPVYRKRDIDDSQIPEHIMSSIEEMY